MRSQALASLCAVVLALAGAGAAATTAATRHAPAATVLNPDLAGLVQTSTSDLLAWGSDAAVWRLAPSGSTWLPDATPHSARIRAIAAAAGGLVAVGDKGLLLWSQDSSATWQSSPAPTQAPLVAVDCRGQTCLAAGGEGVVLRSVDGGSTWQPLQGLAGTLTALQAGRPHHWWVGSADGRLWHSRDDGMQWRSLPLPGATAVEAITADGDTLLVASSDGAIRSVSLHAYDLRQLHQSSRGSFTRFQRLPGPGAWAATGADGACAWRAGPQAPWRSCQISPRRMVRALVASPDGKTWMLAGESGLLLRSTDSGRHWHRPAISGADDTRDLEALAWDPARQGFVAVGSAGLVLRGDPSGRHWRVEHSAPRQYVHDIGRTSDGSLIASLSDRTLARSDDGGSHWTTHRFNALDEPAFLFNVHADPERGSVVVGGGQGSVLVAPDGRHWRHASSGHGVDYIGLLAVPQQALVLLYGTGGHVLRVDSAQATWSRVTLPTDAPLYGGFNAHATQVLLGAGGTVLTSADGGLGWHVERLGGATLRTGIQAPDGRSWLVAGDKGALFRRELGDDGVESAWQSIDAPLADWRFLQQDAAGRALWLGGSGGRFARSTDGGKTWTASTPPTRSALRPPVYDPARRRWWMPGRDGTLLRSDDDGATWRSVFTHTDEHLKGVRVDPASGSLLVFGARLVRIEPGEDP